MEKWVEDPGKSEEEKRHNIFKNDLKTFIFNKMFQITF